MRALGRELSLAVMAGLSGRLQDVAGKLTHGIKTVRLPYAPLPTREELAAKAAGKESSESRWAKRMLERMDRDGALPTTRPSTVQALGIGPFRLVAFNDETCLGYQLKIKKELAPAPAIVAAYCGTSRSYVPTADMLPQKGYEAYSNIFVYLEPAPLAPEAEGILISTALRLARDDQ